MNLVAKKRLDIELMRIIAAFFVLYNHTGANGFSKFLSYDPHTFHYWLYLFLSISCKVSVPLFLVIAGVHFISDVVGAFVFAAIEAYIVTVFFL